MIVLTIGIALGLVIIIGTLFVNLNPEFGAKQDNEILHKINGTNNFTNGKFQNLIETKMGEVKLSTFKDLIFKKGKKPKDNIPVVKHDVNFFENNKNLTRFTWFGHSSIFVEIDGKKLFLDPVIGNVGPKPIGPKRFTKELPFNPEELSKLDAIIISHDHYDHLDYSTIKKLKNKTNKFIVPLGVGEHLRKWGVDENKITELNWWEETSFDTLTFISTPSRHFSGRGLGNRDSTLWASWIIQGSKDKIFFSGDSGYSNHFKEIGNKYGPFDMAMLDSGQYNEAWADIHMNPNESAQASIDLKSKVYFPIHWGEFSLAIHKWKEPPSLAFENAKKLDILLVIPKIGETFTLNNLPQNDWWAKLN